MKPKLLQKLIKKIEKEIEKSRIEKVNAEHKLDQLHNKLQLLKDELAQEQKFAAEQVEYKHTYENFYKSNKNRQMNIADEIVKTKTLIQEIQDKLFEQFRTLKQYEILINRYLQAKKDRLEMEESKLLDEIGIRRIAS